MHPFIIRFDVHVMAFKTFRPKRNCVDLLLADHCSVCYIIRLELILVKDDRRKHVDNGNQIVFEVAKVHICYNVYRHVAI